MCAGHCDSVPICGVGEIGRHSRFRSCRPCHAGSSPALRTTPTAQKGCARQGRRVLSGVGWLGSIKPFLRAVGWNAVKVHPTKSRRVCRQKPIGRSWGYGLLQSPAARVWSFRRSRRPAVGFHLTDKAERRLASRTDGARAGIAQWAEQLPCKQPVPGSSPGASSSLFKL